MTAKPPILQILPNLSDCCLFVFVLLFCFTILSPVLTSSDCLSAANTQTAAVQGKHMGQVYDPDTICRMSVGPHSYLGRVRLFREMSVNSHSYQRIYIYIYLLVALTEAE